MLALHPAARVNQWAALNDGEEAIQSQNPIDIWACAGISASYQIRIRFVTT